MAQFYTKGEKKKRPGVYQRYENNGGFSIATATNGIVAAIISADWGPLNEIVEIQSETDNSVYFGNNEIISQALTGGATTVKVVRAAGSGGKNGSLVLKDTADAAADAVTISAKYPGTRELSITLRSVLGDDSRKEIKIFNERGSVVERFTFEAGEKENEALVKAVELSEYINAAAVSNYTGTGILADVASQPLTGGEATTVKAEDYQAALALFETTYFNTIITDSDNAAIQLMLASYVDRIFQDGNMGFAVIGEPTTVDFETRVEHAAGFNDYRVVYVGEGWINADGNIIDGARAAARIAGMVAAVSSASSLTHGGGVIDRAIKVAEPLTNRQIEKAIDSGMVVFTTSSSGTIWVESAITTLTSPSGEDDASFKKIRRTKTRFELMKRISDTVEPLIGLVTNNENGQNNVTVLIRNVLEAMASEGKIADGATVSFLNAAEGDSAYFEIVVNDLDSLEKIYLTYKFRFTTE